MKRETVFLDKLNCPSCADDLQRALAKMDGVKRAEVAFGTGTLELEYDDSVVTAAEIERIVAGFGVTVAARMSSGS